MPENNPPIFERVASSLTKGVGTGLSAYSPETVKKVTVALDLVAENTEETLEIKKDLF